MTSRWQKDINVIEYCLYSIFSHTLNSKKNVNVCVIQQKDANTMTSGALLRLLRLFFRHSSDTFLADTVVAGQSCGFYAIFVIVRSAEVLSN